MKGRFVKLSGTDAPQKAARGKHRPRSDSSASRTSEDGPDSPMEDVKWVSDSTIITQANYNVVVCLMFLPFLFVILPREGRWRCRDMSSCSEAQYCLILYCAFKRCFITKQQVVLCVCQILWPCLYFANERKMEFFLMRRGIIDD